MFQGRSAQCCEDGPSASCSSFRKGGLPRYRRRGRQGLLEIYPEQHLTIDPELVKLREFCCPLSGTLLDVDCVPPTYPV